MTDIEKLRAWHKRQLGTTEYPSGSNNVIYNTHYYGTAVYGEQYKWCVTYQWDGFRECGLSGLFYGGEHTASCGTLMSWAKKVGQWVTDDFKPGDLALFDFTGKRGTPTHIGWLDRVDGSMCWSYEGNTSRTSDDNGGAVLYRTRQIKLITGAIRPMYKNGGTVYHRQDGVDIVETGADKLTVVMVDRPKRSAADKNYCNAGFFANYAEDGQNFTLPVAHLVADYAADSPLVDYYTHQRGEKKNGKATFNSYTYRSGNDQFYRKAISTLLIAGNTARIADITDLPNGLDYAISGVPIMRDGEDVKFATYVTGQGWEAGNVRATYHVFVGLKTNPSNTVYIMGWQTTKANTIKSAEAYKKFKNMGFRDVIKLDGGGSYIFNVNGKNVSATDENRRINTILAWGDTEEQGNPYTMTTITLYKGSKGEGVKWLQWQLAYCGYDCGGIDGDFGAKTQKAVKAYQKANGLTVDGIVGPATRKKLTGGQ